MTIKKTRLCRHFLKGFCERGNSCGFAHGVDQLHNSPVVIAKKGLQKIGEISSIDDEYNVSENYIFVKNKEDGSRKNIKSPTSITDATQE